MNKYAFRTKNKDVCPSPQQLKLDLESKGISVVEVSPRMVVIESTKEIADEIKVGLGDNWLLIEIDPTVVYTIPKPPKHDLVK